MAPVYSKDTDLELYVQDLERLPLPLTKYHEEAYREIRRVLLTRGVSEEDLAAPSAETLEALKVSSCRCVLALFFGGFPDNPAALEASREHRREFDRTIKNVNFTTAEGVVTRASAGNILLG